VDLVCEGGTLRIDMERGTAPNWTEIEGSSEPNWIHEAVKREWAAFRNTITDGKPVPVTIAHGRGIIAVIEAAYASDQSRREESIAHG
jgi:phthalate 4,5-cis-dihydrodiol dehydrogenase